MSLELTTIPFKLVSVGEKLLLILNNAMNHLCGETDIVFEFHWD